MALILCPECKKQISETSSACPSCGYDFKAAKTKLEQAQAAKGCGIGCLVIVVIAVVMSLFSGDKDSKSTEDRPKTGEAGTIRVLSGGEAPVAISQKALDRFTQLAVAKDKSGGLQMILAKSVWTVPSGTKCHVIESGIFTY